MGGITLAWLIGIGIIAYRRVQKDHRPPSPGQLLAASGFFALTALLAEYPPARPVATLTAFGIDLAAYLQAPLVTGHQPAANPQPAQPRAGAAPAPHGA